MGCGGMGWCALGRIVSAKSFFTTLDGCHYFFFRAAAPALRAAGVFGTNCCPRFMPARFA